MACPAAYERLCPARKRDEAADPARSDREITRGQTSPTVAIHFYGVQGRGPVECAMPPRVAASASGTRRPWAPEPSRCWASAIIYSETSTPSMCADPTFVWRDSGAGGVELPE